MFPKSLARKLIAAVVVFAVAVTILAPAASAAEIGFGVDIRFTGVIQTVGSGAEAWQIGGQKVVTDQSTVVVKLTDPVVAGLWADVGAKKLADGSLLAKQITVRKEQVRLRGEISEKPTDGKVGAWTIAGVKVNVTPDTKIGTRSGALAVGKWVEAVMTEDGGVLTAQQLLGIGDQDFVAVTGEIQEVATDYWLVSGIKLNLKLDGDDKTMISGTPVVGLIGTGAAQLQEDSTLLATALRVAWLDHTAVNHAAEFTGTITAIQTGMMRTLTVVTTDPAMTYTVRLMPNTRVHQEKGLLAVGAEVHVIGWQYFEGQVIAAEVTVLRSPEQGGIFTTFVGQITSLPADGKLGEWKIGSTAVTVNDQTVLMGGAPKLGAWAVGGGIKHADGSVLAVRITVFAPRTGQH